MSEHEKEVEQLIKFYEKRERDQVEKLYGEIKKRENKIWALESIISCLVAVIILGIITYYF